MRAPSSHVIPTAAVVVATVAVACALVPGRDEAPTCRPAYQHELYPETEREQGFPAFEANVWQRPRTLAFQVCDAAVGDLNADGRAELLVADHITAGFGYFLNDPAWLGGRIFEDGVHVPLKDKKNNSAGIVVADFDGDGMLDVANSNHPGTVAVNLNRSQPGDSKLSFPHGAETNVSLGIAHGPEYGLAGREGGLVAADFDGDGRPDIATSDLGKTKESYSGYDPDRCPQGSKESSRYSTTVLINTTEPGDEKASFAERAYFPTVGPAISIASADFNLDGTADIVTADTGSSSLSVLSNHTEQRRGAPPCFGPPNQLMIPAEGLEPQGAGPTNPIAVDLNADGKPDLASANWNARSVTVWINLTDESEAGGEPRFSEPAVVRTGKLPPLVLSAGDLDGDGLPDIVAVPLSTHTNAAVIVIRNETQKGGDRPVFEVDAVYPIPKRFRNDWFYTYFASVGAVHDFDGDGLQDIGVVVARGSLLLKAMKSGDDILQYVDPGVPLWVVHPVLPDHSMLVVYRRTDAVHAHSGLPLCEEPAKPEEDADFCETAEHILERMRSETVDLAADYGGKLSDSDVRAGQADLAAELLRELAAAAPAEHRDDFETVAELVDEASGRVEHSPSWHIDHDADHAVDRVTAFLYEECGS